MSKYVDDIIDAYKRGFEDGRADKGQQNGAFIEKEEMFKRHETGTPLIDTRKVTCASAYIDRSRQ